MKKNAFTLAEVLIVMALIGFLFTLMIPTVVQKQSTTKYIEHLQSAQAKLQTALDMTAKDNNNLPPHDWPSVRMSENKSDAIMKELAKHLQIMSYCGNSSKGCFSQNNYRTLNGKNTSIIVEDMEPNSQTIESDTYTESDMLNQDESGWGEVNPQMELEYTEALPESSSTYVSLIDGGAVVLKTNSTKCDRLLVSTDTLERPLCGVIYVDVNGQNIPNMLGVDVFGFYLSNNSILPMGFYGDDFSFDYNCLRETPRARNSNGLGCTAWALKNRNMEYRKCQAGTRIGWTKATRCDTPPAQK